MFLELTEQSAHGVFDAAGLEGIAALGSTEACEDQHIEFQTGSGMRLEHFVGEFQDGSWGFLADGLLEPLGQAQRICRGIGDQAGLLAG